MWSFLKDVLKLARWWLLLLLVRLGEDRLHAWVNTKIDDFKMMELWDELLNSWIGISGVIFLFGVLLSFLIVAIKLKGKEQETPTTQSADHAEDVQQEIHIITSHDQSGGITAHTVKKGDENG